MRTLVAEQPAIDAVFFTSDVFAVGAILACRELGIAVPDEIGIAGFHDLEIGRVVTPTSPPCMCRRWRWAARRGA